MSVRQLLSCFIIFLVAVTSSNSSSSRRERYHSQRLYSDEYGKFFRDNFGLRIYIHCYDSYYREVHHCRPKSERRRIYDSDRRRRIDFERIPDYRYHHLDGRGNVNVGKGRYLKKGRDVYIECDFPSYDRLLSNIVWYRKTRWSKSGYQRCNHGENRFLIESLGDNRSRLIIFDYDPYIDDGIYRCFATRLIRDTYGRGKESVYVEVDVFPRRG